MVVIFRSVVHYGVCKMMVMPSNHSSPPVHYWAGRYPGKVGWLIGPSAIKKTKLRKWMPFALDNDAFSAWTTGKPWSESAWLKMLHAIVRSGSNPRWVLIPDVVANRDETLAKWSQYAPVAKEFGWPLAFAVQDGMSPSDVPSEAEVVFVGGTTKWKWRTVKIWVSNFPRVHVGRVNTIDKIEFCEEVGVESVDGTGFFKGSENDRKAIDLERWIEGTKHPQIKFDLLTT